MISNPSLPLHTRYPNVTFPGSFYSYKSGNPKSFNLKQLFEANMPHREFFSVGATVDEDKSQFSRLPFGMAAKFFDTSKPVPDPWDWEPTLDKALPSFSLPNSSANWTSLVDTWEHVAVSHYWMAYQAKANMFLIIGTDPNNEKSEKSLWKAAEILELVKLNYPLSRFSLLHLGYIYQYLLDHHQGRVELYALMIKNWDEYLKLPKEKGDKKYEKIKTKRNEMLASAEVSGVALPANASAWLEI